MNESPANSRKPLRTSLIFILLVAFLVIYLPSMLSFANRLLFGKSSHDGMIRLHLMTNLIYEGQPVEDLLAKHGPFRIENGGPYQQFMVSGDYIVQFSGYRLLAKDGRLRFADRWTDSGPVKQIIYFNSLTDNEHNEFEALYWAERRRITQARLDTQIAASSSVMYERIQWMPQLDPKRDARIAVAGVGAYSEPDTNVED